jgi:hypothetical protein
MLLLFMVSIIRHVVFVLHKGIGSFVIVVALNKGEHAARKHTSVVDSM